MGEHGINLAYCCT